MQRNRLVCYKLAVQYPPSTPTPMVPFCFQESGIYLLKQSGTLGVHHLPSSPTLSLILLDLGKEKLAKIV